MHRCLQSGLILLAVSLGIARAQTSATFGDVISIGTQPADIVLDESRQRVYLINTSANTVDIWDYAAQQIAGSIPVGHTPLAGAMSMDGSFLYVTNHDDSTLAVIDLTSSNPSASFVSLPGK